MFETMEQALIALGIVSVIATPVVIRLVILVKRLGI